MMIKIGNTSFNEESIKKMSKKKFVERYKDIILGQDLEALYDQVKGSKVGND